MFKNFEDLQAAGKERLEAVSAASANVFRSLQEIAAETTSYSGNSFKNSLGLIGEIAGAKSFEDAVQAQSAFARSQQESFFKQTAKLGELYVNLGREAFRPVEVALAKLPATVHPSGNSAQG